MNLENFEKVVGALLATAQRLQQFAEIDKKRVENLELGLRPWLWRDFGLKFKRFLSGNLGFVIGYQLGFCWNQELTTGSMGF